LKQLDIRLIWKFNCR